MSIRLDGANGTWLSIDDLTGMTIYPEFKNSEAYTVCLWFKPEAPITSGTFQTLFISHSLTTIDCMDTLNLYDPTTDSKLCVEAMISGSATTPNPFFGTTVLTTGTWFHAAMRRTSGTVIQILLNGVQEATNSTRDVSGRVGGSPDKFPDQMHVCCWQDATIGFKGSITQLRVWTTNLSDAEIVTEMNSATHVKTASLWADWALPSTSDYTDHSGFSHSGGAPFSSALAPHGTITNGADDPVQTAVTVAQYLNVLETQRNAPGPALAANWWM